MNTAARSSGIQVGEAGQLPLVQYSAAARMTRWSALKIGTPRREIAAIDDKLARIAAI
jgi:hypothetical protein